MALPTLGPGKSGLPRPLGQAQQEAAKLKTLTAHPNFLKFLRKIWDAHAQRSFGNDTSSVADRIYAMYNDAGPSRRAANVNEVQVFQKFVNELRAIATTTQLEPWTQHIQRQQLRKFKDIEAALLGSTLQNDHAALQDVGTAFYWFGPGGNAQERVYVHTADGKATKVMGFLVPALQSMVRKNKIKALAIKVAGPLENRLDTIVVYLQSTAEQSLVVAELKTAIARGGKVPAKLAPGDFVKGTPEMTKELLPDLPGVATGTEPERDKMDLNLSHSPPAPRAVHSFGSFRADLIAQALLAAGHSRMYDEFCLKVETLFWQNGIRMDDPSRQTPFAGALQENLKAVKDERARS